MQTRQAELAQAIPMPGEEEVSSRDWVWSDPSRTQADQEPRTIPVRLYWPKQTPVGSPLPLVVFSHGLGGSREGYSYLGRYWAAHGFASLHLQHAGSDRHIWDGPASELVKRLQQAAQTVNAIDRAKDVQFALNRVLSPQPEPALPFVVDAQKIAIAGHSYGANTSLLIAGAQAELNGHTLSLRDPRVKAAIILSAPPFYGAPDFNPILRPAQIPALHITSTDDDILVPGYGSRFADRVKVFEAYGATDKTLMVFKNGSHSIFTDRLHTGGETYNPQVKIATRELTLEFLQSRLLGQTPDSGWPSAQWMQRHGLMLDRAQTGNAHLHATQNSEIHGQRASVNTLACVQTASCQ